MIKETLVDYFKHVILITEVNDFENNFKDILSILEVVSQDIQIYLSKQHKEAVFLLPNG